MGVQYGGRLGPTLIPQPSTGTPQYQTPQGSSPHAQLGGLRAPYYAPSTPYAGPQPTQDALPTPGLRPQSLPYFGHVDKVLQDSNPVHYPHPVGTTAQPAGQQYQPFPAMSSGGQQAQQNIGGAVLGSSTSQPPWYGGGLAPASGLGGGLYPSLVSLYR